MIRGGRERGSMVGVGPVKSVGCAEGKGGCLVFVDEGLASEGVVEVTAAGEGVDVAHHTFGSVNVDVVVAEHFLRPTAKLVNGAAVVRDLLDGGAVADPVEHSAP